MSNNDFEYSDLDAILAEFRGENVSPRPAAPRTAPKPAAPEEPVYEKPPLPEMPAAENPYEQTAPEATVLFDLSSLDSRFAQRSSELERISGECTVHLLDGERLVGGLNINLDITVSPVCE